ncbi:MAG: alpha/beta hydrolase [Moorea sp. SIO2I5]|nr:alpha/beta hydrolase [Moorena sp. SIO2I5]
MEQAQIIQAVTAMAQAMAKPIRTPVYRRPDEYGMEYEDIFFNAIDGTRLEGWFIPANSDRLIICSHFGPGNRYGFAGHLEELSFHGGFEVNFLPKYKALHEAGYNIVAYDIRDHGLSASSGTNGFSQLEWRDIIGAVKYAKSRPETRDLKTSLHTMCLGCNSTLIAMAKQPQEFEHIISMTALQPVLGRAMIEKSCQSMGIDPKQGAELYDEQQRKIYGFRLDDYDIMKQVSAIKIPTLVLQVRNDASMQAEAIQGFYDALPNPDKQIIWVEETTERFRGYTYFSDHPEQLVAWFDSHMK